MAMPRVRRILAVVLLPSAMLAASDAYPPPRFSDESEISAWVQRSISRGWDVYVEAHWERSRSNEIAFNYRANTSILGVQRTY